MTEGTKTVSSKVSASSTKLRARDRAAMTIRSRGAGLGRNG
jgi:hypothetical protein